MSADGDAPSPHEVVIVRRRGGDGEDGHHGGAWKIAFADLMTAMMAFFLVMWLLNASDKEKIQQIATYFNPMKLNSKRPTEKGVEENVDVPKAKKKDKPGQAEKQNPDKAEDKKKPKQGVKGGGDGDRKEGADKQAEEELFNDPYGVLSRLATKASESKAQGKGIGGGGRDGPGTPGGDTFTNPFEPYSEQLADGKSPSTKTPSPLDTPAGQQMSAPPGVSPLDPLTPLEPTAAPPVVQPPVAEKPAETPPAPAAQPTPPEVAKAEPPKSEPDKSAEEKAMLERAEKEKAQAAALEGEIMKALGGMAAEDKPSIEVTRVDDGILISLTDDFRFGMFTSGSAEPNPELVLVMDKVGKILSSRTGNVVVRGHTDARPFKSLKNSNWRLSTDRAQMAYYMLVRGGVDEKRFERIEGYADRSLKMPSDPNAAQNRRIEILLKVPKA